MIPRYATLRPLIRAFTPTKHRSFTTPAPDPKTLLIVYHSRTGQGAQMATSVARGALSVSKEMETPLNVSKLTCHEATVSDMLNASGYIFICPENLASASGAMLEFFHSSYYSLFTTQENENGDYSEQSLLISRPYGIAISSGSDGTSAFGQLKRICTGLRLKQVSEESVICKNGLVQTKDNILREKVLGETHAKQCEELGGLVAAHVLL
jgi:hypothetical protein